MIERLESIKKKYEEIAEQLADQNIISNIKKATELAKEQALIRDVYYKYLEYLKIEEGIKESEELLEDSEFSNIAKEEIKALTIKKGEAITDLEVLLIPKDPNDGKNVMVEIRGAAGGNEANIFAGDLYRMYLKYAEKENWKIEMINSISSEAGGFSNIEFMVKGDNVYSKLKYESGAHRVQRVPVTETQGRVHTSTATVLVMPEVEELDVEIKQEDLRIDVYRSSGAGGQSVNTTDSAVRITHLPTNVVVTCQNEKSQHKNKAAALKILKIRVYEKEREKREEELGAERKSKIGTGDRSEKIRTYNYPQNRVTDHRINFTTKQLDRVMEGHIDDIIEALISEDQRKKLEGKNED